MQSQIMCSGCRSLLLYPRGASNVCCALCNTITPVPAPPPVATAMDMAQLVCGGCRTLLMHTRGASTVRCSCCHTVNLAQAHVTCGNCRTTLMYPSGAPSVKCAICQYVTNVCMPSMRVSLPVNRPNGTNGTVPSTSSSVPHTQTHTVVVENPMSVDESGKLVSNVVVGVTTEKK